LEEKTWELSKIIILQHDITHPHMAKMTKATFAATGWEIVNHLPYSPELAPVISICMDQ
jgi:hypothetical protein